MSYHTVQRQDYNGTRFLLDAQLNAKLTPLQLDAGMHTGKEGTEAMPYFDTFDLETIDILLISQYVFPFIFVYKQLLDKPVEDGLLGLARRTEIEDDPKTRHGEMAFIVQACSSYSWVSPFGQTVLLEQTGNTILFTIPSFMCFSSTISRMHGPLPFFVLRPMLLVAHLNVYKADDDIPVSISTTSPPFLSSFPKLHSKAASL